MFYSKYIFDVWVVFSMFLGKLRSNLLKLHEMIRVPHIFASSVVFILLCNFGQHGGVLEYMKKLSLWSISLRFWAGLDVDHTVLCKNCDTICYNCVPNGFFCALKSRLAVRCTQSYGECSNLGIFTRQGSFLEVSGQVKEWIKLKINEMIRIAQVISCTMVFILLCD